MSPLTLLLLLLGLQATPTTSGEGILPFAAALLSPDSGWVEDPNGPTCPGPTPDSGWEFDPNG